MNGAYLLKRSPFYLFGMRTTSAEFRLPYHLMLGHGQFASIGEGIAPKKAGLMKASYYKW